MKDLIVGIDLGTTNSEIAVLENGVVRVLEIQGSPIMPSCVGLDAAGRLIVGQPARNQLIAAPESTLLSIKRKMGQDIKVPLGGKEYSPEEISSFILRQLKLGAESVLGREVRKAVITVPAFFNDRQRKATAMAGELAGLEVVRILNEPTAAALAYGADHSEDERMLVYDLGGGTFDVSVVVVEQGVVEVKASHGDTQLGGDDFDMLLVNYVVEDFNRRHNTDLICEPRVMRRLKVILEQAKRRLSDEPFVLVREEYLDGRNHLEIEISRHLYQELIRPLVDRTLDCVHKALQDARLTPADIDKVMLAGGATRTPLVRETLEERLRVEPRFEVDPDLIVAMGAAVQAGIIAGEPHPSILVDITPHTFSTGSLGFLEGRREYLATPIIRRNTPLPACKADLFATVLDNQTEVEVTAYQGESQFPDENVLLGKFIVSGLSRAPAGNAVVIRFDLDLNGMLKVTATEKTTGLAKTVVMDTRGKKTFNVEESRRNIASLLGGSFDEGPDTEVDDDEDGGFEPHVPELKGPSRMSMGVPPIPAAPSTSSTEGPAVLLAAAKDLRKRAEALLLGDVSPEDAAEIRTLLQATATAIAQQNWKGLDDANDQLSDLLFYLED